MLRTVACWYPCSAKAEQAASSRRWRTIAESAGVPIRCLGLSVSRPSPITGSNTCLLHVFDTLRPRSRVHSMGTSSREIRRPYRAISIVPRGGSVVASRCRPGPGTPTKTFTAHAPAESRVEVVPLEPDLDGCEHQVDLAIAIEVVSVHRDLDTVRLDRDVNAPREHGTAIGCWRAEMHLVGGLLSEQAPPLQRENRQIGDAVAVEVGKRVQATRFSSA